MKAYTSDSVAIEPGDTVYLNGTHPIKVQGIETRNGKTPEIILQFGEWGETGRARPLGYWDMDEQIYAKRQA